jgi:hypothetical protein
VDEFGDRKYGKVGARGEDEVEVMSSCAKDDDDGDDGDDSVDSVASVASSVSKVKFFNHCSTSSSLSFSAWNL